MPTSLNLRRAKARSGIHAAAREYRKVVHIDSTLERETRKVVVRKYNKYCDVIETERTDHEPRLAKDDPIYDTRIVTRRF